jgi:hypothetical protein
MASTANNNDEEDLVYDAQRRPHLHHLLQDSLPKLGLDCETYGPYVWGDEDDDDSDDDKDVDELKDLILGVLQASSETHSEDDDVWTDLIEQIIKANALDSKRRRESKDRHLQETKTKLEEDLAKAKLEEQQQQPEEDGKNNDKSPEQQKADAEAKRQLMERFGYELDDDEEQTNNASGGGKKSSSAKTATTATATTNRDVAAAHNSEKSKAMKNQSKTTKADERKKTKENRSNKEEKKEARRKKAVKGERQA